LHEADAVVAKVSEELHLAERQLGQSLPRNPFAAFENGELRLKREDKLEIPERVRFLSQTIEARVPHIRVEDLLWEVNQQCGFLRAFRSLPGCEPRLGNLYLTLLAAITAHAANLGAAAMSQSAEGITLEGLQEASRWFLREPTLKASNTILVNYHHQLPLSVVWGAGTFSSSDGQRFGIQRSSLLASFYPRYFGYYDRALFVYTHISDQFSVFGTQVNSCVPREALYVLDGLLKNDTILRLREHRLQSLHVHVGCRQQRAPPLHALLSCPVAMPHGMRQAQWIWDFRSLLCHHRNVHIQKSMPLRRNCEASTPDGCHFIPRPFNRPRAKYSGRSAAHLGKTNPVLRPRDVSVARVPDEAAAEAPAPRQRIRVDGRGGANPQASARERGVPRLAKRVGQCPHEA
jgi:hypothetical protein